MSMKSILILFGILFSGLFLQAQTDSITVSGTLKNLNDGKVGVSFSGAAGKNKYFTAKVKDNYIEVRLPAQSIPVIARLNVSPKADKLTDGGYRPMIPIVFFPGNHDLKIQGDAEQMSAGEVRGDLENDHYSDLVAQCANGEIRYQQLLMQLTNKNLKRSSADSLNLHQEVMSISRNNDQRQKNFIQANPGSYAAVWLLSRMENRYTADDYLAAWKGLDATYKNTPEGVLIKKDLQKLSATLAGTPVPAFERIDKDGNRISPALLKGKTYLLDFWGSWCGPCRASHPHLKTLYNKYKSAGFEIVAIANERGKTLEESKLSWLKAIKADQINWIHILNQDGVEKQNLVSTFQVNVFPTKILVGADGKIILRISASATDDIDKALSRIYGF
jgi:thiol-disulfide isomerase/thioredoxin/acylphosphatase